MKKEKQHIMFIATHTEKKYISSNTSFKQIIKTYFKLCI